MPISAIVITFNEEHNIARCLEALRPVAAEIVVVDSFSTDRTVAIAESLGARVFRHPFEGYGEQKAVALSHTTHDWVLSVDADEVLSPELQRSLLAASERPEYDAYQLAILPNYCGHWIRHCGWYPQPKVRFWNKTKGYMRADKVHEGWVLHQPDAKVGYLKGDLLHYSFPTISSHLKKVEHYSEVGARFDVARGKKASLLKIWLGPKWVFFTAYILRGGFLDGYYGYVVCKNSAFAAFAKYTKIRQYTKG